MERMARFFALCFLMDLTSFAVLALILPSYMDPRQGSPCLASRLEIALCAGFCWIQTSPIVGEQLVCKDGCSQPMEEGDAYSEISAGDQHLCGLRKPNNGSKSKFSFIDCWGYNMTTSQKYSGEVTSITAGSLFNCGLFARNGTAFCWGDETGSGVIDLTPTKSRFRSISAGGYHVCGILGNSRVFCWGSSLGMQGDVDLAPSDPMLSVVGGRFHACGILTVDQRVLCWGFHLQKSVPHQRMQSCIRLPPGLLHLRCSCRPFSFSRLLGEPAVRGRYQWPLPRHMQLQSLWSGILRVQPSGFAGAISDRRCEFNCTSCVSAECSSLCSQKKSSPQNLSSFQLPIFISELAFGVVLMSSVSLFACLYVRYKLHRCTCGAAKSRAAKSRSCSFHKESVKVRPELEELKIHRARTFAYEELAKATGGFTEESQVGKGSFSCVFKGVLKDGTVVAVKRAIRAPDLKKSSKEFRTELDLLSRLNHAHLLNLLGYCEEGRERLLVYEFMAHGSLYQHLHGSDPALKEKLDWVRRVTIAVQAARGIEYLHGYACPPVIHRDIKSSNILIDEEHNARVADFGLSLLGPADSSTPLSELPAGTLGYLDPEYYRLHYLTTKSDVYSFGVLMLEILSGRKAIDLRFEDGNIVEWAVPKIKSGEVSVILDPVLRPPAEPEALKKIANIACRCVRMRGKDRPSMDKVTTELERALALLLGTPCNDQPILPTEVVLGSSRLHKKGSQRSSTMSCSENEAAEGEEQPYEYRAPSWITFPSVASSQRRKSSVSDGDVDGGKNGLRCLEEEIGPASPHQELFLQHNF
ncbi:hypothetical protein HPP92_023394 [Vanilla planifolia]|uniref:non-specific serine/threonine protein kinase n=1 Tax=Vanilla planifolia TaxID=51239 RepID=A0A835PTV6_VANPL|nr:hypothetical protein HPP92_023394 [Vanilla planifolia]